MEIFNRSLLQHSVVTPVEPSFEIDEDSADVGGPAIVLPGGWWKLSLQWENVQWKDAQQIIAFLHKQGKRTWGLPMGDYQIAGANLSKFRRAAAASGDLFSIVSLSRPDDYAEFVWQHGLGAAVSESEAKERGESLQSCFCSIAGRLHRFVSPGAWLGRNAAGDGEIFRATLRPIIPLDSFNGGSRPVGLLNPIVGVKIVGNIPNVPFQNNRTTSFGVELIEVQAQ